MNLRQNESIRKLPHRIKGEGTLYYATSTMTDLE